MQSKEYLRSAFLKQLEDHPLCYICNTNPHAANDRRCNPCRSEYLKDLRKRNGGKWYHELTPEAKTKRLARQRVYDAIKWDRLKREACVICGANSEGHHHVGYDKANSLNVVWLCRLHHREIEKVHQLTGS
jgi:hypothetical protein